MRGCLCIFLYIWMMSSSPGSRTIEPILWLKLVLESRLQYESVEDLMDFLAFLVQKLRQNKQNLIREIPTNPLGNSYNIWGLLAITLVPETLGVRSRALKTHITALNPKKFWATILAHCLCADIIKQKPKKQNIPQPWWHPPKVPNPNHKFVFSPNYKTSTNLSRVWIAL